MKTKKSKTNTFMSLVVIALTSSSTMIFSGGEYCVAQTTVSPASSSRRVPDEDRKTELGVHQRFVEQKMVAVENNFTSTAERIKESEPERAQRLVAAYQQAKETLITRKMVEARKMLDVEQYDQAEGVLNKVIDELDRLLRLLINDKPEKMSKKEEIAQMQQWKNAIQNLKKEQNKQTKETNKVANKEEALEKLENQIKQVSKLIQDQQNVITKTMKKDAGIRAMDQVADKQFEVRKETEELEKEIGGEPKNSDANSEQGNQGSKGEQQKGQPGEKGQQGEQKNQQGEKGQQDENKQGQQNENKQGQQGEKGEQQQGEQKGQQGEQKGQQGEQKGQQGEQQQQQGQQQQGQQQQGQQQQGQQQQGQQQQGQQQQGQQQQQQQQQPQPGQQPLQQAAKHQKKAEERLGSGKPKDAKREAEKALAELEKAKNELSKEKRRLASLPPEALKQMADKQRRTRDKAMDVAKAMSEAPKPKQDAGNQANQQQQQQQQPGQQEMQEASESMEKAAGDLQEEDPDQAERQQREAEKKLDEALKEIEERLNQLRDETREEKLKRLEARFREMLDRQQVAGVETVELNDKKVNLGQLKRRDDLVMLRVANEELEISEIGQQAYDLLLEDGTSNAFPEIVQGVRDDLSRVSELLQDGRTDQLTQLIQQDIMSTLADMLEALKESKNDKKDDGGGGGGGGGGNPDQPLLKLSAELKILRAKQNRLNRRTSQLDRMAGDVNNGQIQEQIQSEMQKLTESQGKLLEMAEGIMEAAAEQQQQQPQR